MTETKAGREPPIRATAQTLDDLAKTNSDHQIRLLMEIKSLEGKMQCPASETRSSAHVPVERGPASVAQSSMKKPKMLVQSTFVGYVFFARRGGSLPSCATAGAENDRCNVNMALVLLVWKHF